MQLENQNLDWRLLTLGGHMQAVAGMVEQDQAHMQVVIQNPVNLYLLTRKIKIHG